MAVIGSAQKKTKKVGVSAKKPSAHPTYATMVKEAISTLKERSGSSQVAIAKFIEDKYKIQNLSSNYKKLISSQLKKLVASGSLVKVKNSFKLGAIAKPKVPSKKPANTKIAKPKLAGAAKPKNPNTAKKVAPKKKDSPVVITRAKKVVMKEKKPKSAKSPVKKKVAVTKKAKK